jgi:hypothetical protein
MRLTSIALARICALLICVCSAAGAQSGAIHIIRNPGTGDPDPSNHLLHPKPIPWPSDRPLWRVDLHSLGFPSGNDELQRQRNLGSFDTVDFVSDNTLVASFLTRENVPGLQRRDDSSHIRPFRLHALFFDSASGALKKSLDWPIEDVNAGIFPRYDGSFLFFSTERIVLYSNDWAPIKELPLHEFQVPGTVLVEIAESPTGASLSLRIRRGGTAVCVRIATTTLEGQQEQCSDELPFTISDSVTAWADAQYAATMHAEPGQMPSVKTRDNGPEKGPASFVTLHDENRDRGFQVLCELREMHSCGTPAFISGDKMVVFDNELLSLLDLKQLAKANEVEWEFERFFLDGPKDGPYWLVPLGRPVRPSANGLRFAAALNLVANKWDAVDPRGALAVHYPSPSPAVIDVFDLPRGMNSGMAEQHQCQQEDQPCDWWIYRLKNSHNQFKRIWGFALAPNGAQLAVDSGGIVQLYDLPLDSKTQ